MIIKYEILENYINKIGEKLRFDGLLINCNFSPMNLDFIGYAPEGLKPIMD